MCTCAGCLRPVGMEGWRFAFLSVALVSLAIGGLNFAFGHDPRFSSDRQLRLQKAEDSADDSPSFLQLLRETRAICTIPTFLIIITQVSPAGLM